MEKFTGDLTDLFFDIFPKTTLQEMILDTTIKQEESENIFKIFKEKIRIIKKTIYNSLFRILIDLNIKNRDEYNYFIMQLKQAGIQTNILFSLCNDTIVKIDNEEADEQNSIDHVREHRMYHLFRMESSSYDQQIADTIEYINKILLNPISEELFDNFISRLYEKIDYYMPLLIKEILKINLELIKIGFYHYDNKFDNYGFKLINKEEKIDDGFERLNLPEIDGKFIYIYFLDWDSGLYELITTRNSKYNENYKIISEEFAKIYNDAYEKIIGKININFDFGLFGGRKLKSAIESIINDSYIKLDTVENILSQPNLLDGYNRIYESIDDYRKKNVDSFKLLNKKYVYKIKFMKEEIKQEETIEKTIENIEKFIGYEVGSTTRELLKNGYKNKDDPTIEYVLKKYE